MCLKAKEQSETWQEFASIRDTVVGELSGIRAKLEAGNGGPESLTKAESHLNDFQVLYIKLYMSKSLYCIFHILDSSKLTSITKPSH